MRTRAIATWTLLIASLGAIALDLSKSGYLEFTDIQRLIPNSNPQVFAEILKGNDKDCLTKPSQTKPVTMAQIRTLRQLTDKDQISALLGNGFCETKKGIKYLTESGRELTIKIDGILDYDFSTGTTSKPLLSRPSKKRVAREKAE